MTVLAEVVLTAVLGGYGWFLVQGMPNPRVDLVQSVMDANTRLLLSDAAGIDVGGQFVSPTQLPGAKRVVAFLIRSGSVSADLEFWRGVARELPSDSGVRVVGYCDGHDCLAAVGTQRRPLVEFPVIAYGQVVDTQAVLNADVLGSFILKDNAKESRPRSLPWRGPNTRPVIVARQVLVQ